MRKFWHGTRRSQYSPPTTSERDIQRTSFASAARRAARIADKNPSAARFIPIPRHPDRRPDPAPSRLRPSTSNEVAAVMPTGLPHTIRSTARAELSYPGPPALRRLRVPAWPERQLPDAPREPALNCLTG